MSYTESSLGRRVEEELEKCIFDQLTLVQFNFDILKMQKCTIMQKCTMKNTLKHESF